MIPRLSVLLHRNNMVAYLGLLAWCLGRHSIRRKRDGLRWALVATLETGRVLHRFVHIVLVVLLEALAVDVRGVLWFRGTGNITREASVKSGDPFAGL